jgi:hypothetical protein
MYTRLSCTGGVGRPYPNNDLALPLLPRSLTEKIDLTDYKDDASFVARLKSLDPKCDSKLSRLLTSALKPRVPEEGQTPRAQTYWIQ